MPFPETGKAVAPEEGKGASVLDKLSIWCLQDIHIEMSSQQWMTGAWNSSEDEVGELSLGVINMWVIFKAVGMV